MRINTNINSMRTQEYMRQNQAKMSNAMDRLSSGKRINNASDDAAGLAIATRMRARESGLGVAANNTQDGMSLIRTADSAMNSVSNILLRMRDLANQSSNGTNTLDNQKALNKEFDALKEQINYIAENTQFNDKNLLDGSNPTIAIQTLDSANTTKQINIELGSVSTNSLNISGLKIDGTDTKELTAPDLAPTTGAAAALKGLDDTKTADQIQKAVDSFTTAFEKVKDFMPDAKVKLVNDAINAYTKDKSLDNAKAIEAAFTPNTPKAGDKANVSANSAIKAIDAALETIASNRATLGATLNRLDFNVNNLKSQSASMVQLLLKSKTLTWRKKCLK